MAVFCHVKKGDKVIVNSGKFKKTVGNITAVFKLDKNKFIVSIDSIPKISKKKKKSEDIVEKDVLIDSSNVLLLKSRNN
jgi:ribosomal protein L24